MVEEKKVGEFHGAQEIGDKEKGFKKCIMVYIYRYSLVQSLLLDTFWSFNIQKDPTIITSQATQGPPMGLEGKPKRSSKLCVFCLKVLVVKSMLLQK